MPAPHWPAMTAFFCAPSRRGRRPPQRGAAALEFTLAAAIALLLALLALEATRWQLTRQVAQLALMEAARAGSTGHADPALMRAAFLRALLPLHAGPGGAAGARRRQARNLEHGAALMGMPPWRIEILRPLPSDGHARAPDGRPQGGTLELRLTYLYRPLLAPLRTLLAALAPADDSYGGQAWRHGLASIGMELVMEMHSEPRDEARGRPPPAGMVQGACRRLRCPRTDAPAASQ